jgi:hypothetical protein
VNRAGCVSQDGKARVGHENLIHGICIRMEQMLTGIDNKIKIYYLKTYGYLYFNICKVGIYYTICLSLIQIMEAQPSVANNILTH